MSATFTFVLVAEGGLPRLAAVLRQVFEHPWVASYQVGFGPPLVRSSDRLIERLRGARSALEKLEAYAEVCLLNEDERKRLAGMHRRVTVRRLGPIDAEELDKLSAEVLDLSVRVYHPALAPPKVADEMRALGVPFDLLPMHTPPDELSARLPVRLADPRGARWLDAGAVRAAGADPDHGLAIPLEAPARAQALYACWLRALADKAENGGTALKIKLVELGDPLAHARVKRDGEAR